MFVQSNKVTLSLEPRIIGYKIYLVISDQLLNLKAGSNPILPINGRTEVISYSEIPCRMEGSVSAKRLSLKIKKLKPNAILPQRATSGSTGLDLYACLDNADATMTLETFPKMIGTGIAIEIPEGYDVQIRPRSGLSARGVGVTFGTVDSDYRGEVKVTMYLLSEDASYEVKHGDRIAQMVVSRIEALSIVEVKELSTTERDCGGHGSTGR